MFRYAKLDANRTLEEAEQLYSARVGDAKRIYDKYAQQFVERDCPICGSSKSKQGKPFRGTYKVSICETCGTPYVNPVPNPEALVDYYTNSTCREVYRKLVKRRNTGGASYVTDERVLKSLEALRGVTEDRPIRVLEVGSGSGHFLARLKEAVNTELPGREIALIGLDLDIVSINNPADPDLDLQCLAAEEINSLEPNSFDLVAHFEFIEHLVDPYQFMSDVKKILRVGGKSVFTTPNIHSVEMKALDYNNYRLMAHAIFPPMHINAFGTMNMVHFVLRSGLKVVEIETPGRLDMDILTHSKDFFDDDGLKLMVALDEPTKALLQHLMQLSRSSGVMSCVVEK